MPDSTCAQWSNQSGGNADRRSTTLRTLVVFTDTFPFGTGETFLETEVEYLVRGIERVIVVPVRGGGVQRRLPVGAELETSLAERRLPRAGARATEVPLADIAQLLWQEVVSQPALLVSGKRLDRARRFLRAVGSVYRWMVSFLSAAGAEADGAAFYTYWLGAPTLAVGLARDRFLPRVVVVSRAHGVDLYAERHRPAYLPFRAATLAAVDRLFLISEHGRRYCAERHPSAAPRCEVARLGVRDPGFLASIRADDVFRCVSCSALVAVKRIDRLIDALAACGRAAPGRQLEWHHLGDGPLRTELDAQARRVLPPNARVVWHGQVANREVIDFYRRQPVDVFVNVSESEGLPVAVMEAQSCGIPVVATAVGGTEEIVSARGGILLPAVPTVAAIATALSEFAEPNEALNRKRAASRESWSTLCRAEANYGRFIERLRAVCAAPRAPRGGC